MEVISWNGALCWNDLCLLWEEVGCKRGRRMEMIYRKEIYDEDFEKYNVKPKVISDGDKFDSNYGMDFALLTDEHIKALQEGKALYIDINGGEYCCLLKKQEK